MFLLAAITFLTTAGLLTAVFSASLNNQMRREARQEALLLAEALDTVDVPLAHIDRLGRLSDTRVTLIASGGAVLYDSAARSDGMDNHLGRPEVASALLEGIGQSERLSDTIGERTYYCAVRLRDGSIVRLGRTTDSLFAALTGAAALVLMIAGGVSVLSLLLADRMTRRIIEPINALDLELPGQGEIYDELSPLLLRIRRQQAQISEQMAQLQARREEFSAITGNMSEGLVLLDAEGRVLTVNPSALALLHTPAGRSCEGRNYLVLDRCAETSRTVEAALSGTRKNTLLEREGRTLQLYASPVLGEGGRPRGALLLLLDVTERSHAERLRREFSANVSHELKTPLTSISGFAELMKDGMVKPRDVASIAGRIHREASRLIALVEDIIQLSRLDEHSIDAAAQPVELRALALDVAGRLAPQAAAAGVDLKVTGEPLTVPGVAPLVDELLHNLCENAVKYNRPHGQATVALSRVGETAVIEVSDTGIGIAPEHQSRVFERFYRVDKSHSRQTGGTGLGLSIVKHAVEYHGGNLRLSSTPGVGTTVRVTLPGARD